MKTLKMNEQSEDENIFIEAVINKEPVTIVDLYDEIDNLEENEPSDKRCKEYKAWLSKINSKFVEANKLCGSKIYKLIK